MTIRSTAEQMSKSPTTIQRWKRTHPALYQASMEFNEYGSPKALYEALKTCKSALIDAGIEHSEAVQKAREVLK